MAKLKRRIHKYEAEAAGYKEEPTWNDSESFTADELNTRLLNAFNYYNYIYNLKDFQRFFVEYVATVDKKKVASIRAANNYINRTLGMLARMVINGLVRPFHLQDRLDKEIE